MLTSTFIHAPGIGHVTERSLWSQGASTWLRYLENASRYKTPARHRAMLDTTVRDSVDALELGRVDYFARNLAAREHWRALVDFPKIGYLDIETDGGSDPGAITMIGLYDGYETRMYVKGDNLAQFAFECQEFDGFVTFFGGGFDLPFLKRRFPVLESVFADRLHVDLCPLLKGLGYRGGLKSIERQLGVRRRPETDGLSGYDAVRLWRAAQGRGESSADAMRLLRAYNEEDVVNMKALLDFALPKLHAAAGLPTDPPVVRPESVFDLIAA